MPGRGAAPRGRSAWELVRSAAEEGADPCADQRASRRADRGELPDFAAPQRLVGLELGVAQGQREDPAREAADGGTDQPSAERGAPPPPFPLASEHGPDAGR